MEFILDPENRVLLSAGVGTLAMILILTLLGLRWRAANSVVGRLRGASNDILLNILVPDGDDSEIHIDYALLTPRGVVIVDVRDVIGNVFGSDAMEEWTVLSDKDRFTFSNPQHGLYDRIAAVKRMLSDVPVDGFVAFTNRGEFTKGTPTQVVMLDEFVEELRNEKTVTPPESIAEFYPEWERLRENSVAAQADQLRHK